MKTEIQSQEIAIWLSVIKYGIALSRGNVKYLILTHFHLVYINLFKFICESSTFC